MHGLGIPWFCVLIETLNSGRCDIIFKLDIYGNMVRHFPCCKAKAIDDLKLDHVMDVFVKTDLTYDLTFSVFEKC